MPTACQFNVNEYLPWVGILFAVIFYFHYLPDEAVKILHSYLPVNDGNHALGSPRLSGISQTFYSIVNCMLNSSETENLAKDENIWRDLTTESLQKLSHPSENETCIGTDDLAERLHLLADRLPRKGVFVDVVWWVGDKNNNGIPIEEHMELYGALKRLVEWNGALVSLVTGSDNDILTHWADMLRADLRSLSDLGSLPLLWRGAINITSTDTMVSSVKLSGFELRALYENIQETQLTCDMAEQEVDIDPQILSSQMEFIAEVPLSEVPGFYITHTAYKLQLSSHSPLNEKSAKFLERLRQNKQLCYLVRLAYGPPVTEDTARLRKRRKEKEEKTTWKEFVVENAADLTTGLTTKESLHNVSHHSMLLHATRSPQTLDSQVDNTILAYLLRPLDHLHGNALHNVTMTQLRQSQVSVETAPPGDSEGVLELIRVLPHISADVLLQIEANIERLQTALILAWKEETGETLPTVDELSSLLSSARVQYLQQLDESGWFGLDHAFPPAALHVARQNVAEYDLDPRDQLERKVLLLESSSSNVRFAHHKTSDNLDGLSPPHGAQVVALNAAQFRKFFRADGTALKDDLSPLHCKQSGHPKWRHHPEGELLDGGDWRECGGVKYHGVHYNQDPTSEEIERWSSRLLARLRNLETASTCTVDQTYGSATMTVPNSKIHRSQRKCKTEKPGERKRGQKRGAEEAFADNNNDGTIRDSHRASQGLSASHRMTTARQRLDTVQQHQRRQRSQRHKQKLEQVVKDALVSRGVAVEDDIFESCALRLYGITKSYVKDLTTSRHLKEEMEKIASDHVLQVINFERNRRSTTKT